MRWLVKNMFKKFIVVALACCVVSLPCTNAHTEAPKHDVLKLFIPTYEALKPRLPIEPIAFEVEEKAGRFDKYEEPEVEEEVIEEPVEPEIVIDPEERELLACVIYQEAGSDACCDDCRRRVADVVLNRVESDRFPYANTIHEVLTAKRQYGRFYWTGVVWPDRASNPGEKHAVERAYRIAEEVLSGQHSELYGQGYVWQAEFKQGKDIVCCCDIYFGR